MKDEWLNFSILEGHLGRTSQGRVTKLSYSIFYAHLNILEFYFSRSCGLKSNFYRKAPIVAPPTFVIPLFDVP